MVKYLLYKINTINYTLQYNDIIFKHAIESNDSIIVHEIIENMNYIPKINIIIFYEYL